MTSRLEKIATLFGLVFTAAVTVATSKASDQPSRSFPVTSFLVASNCQGAIPQEAITVQFSQVLTPTGRTFQSYGLPSQAVTIGAGEVNGSAGGLSRRCVYEVYQTTPSYVHLYSCYDDGVPACQVSFEVMPGNAKDTGLRADSLPAPKDPSDPPQS